MRQVRSLGRARGAEVRAETLAGFGGPYRGQLFEILGFVPRSPISRYCDGGRPVYVHECGDRTRPTNTHTHTPLESGVAGASWTRVFKGDKRGGGRRGATWRKSQEPPDGRLWHPVSSAPGSGGAGCAANSGPFVIQNVQNRGALSFSLPLSSNVDLDEKYGAKLQSPVPRSDPQAAFRSAEDP